MRRIWLVVAVMAVGVLAVGAAQAMAAKSKSKSKAPKTVTTTVSCKVSLGTLSAPGETAVIPPAAQGSQYGPVHCGGAIGSGIQSDTFKLMDSGDVQGKYAQYFGTGTVHGSFSLTPDDTGAPSSTTTFANVSYTGTMNVAGGTGAYKKATGKGTLKCSSNDGVHFSCTSKLKLSQPPAA